MYLGRRAEKEEQAHVDGATSLSSGSRLASLAEAIQPNNEEDPVSATAALQGRDPDAEPPTDSQAPDDEQQVCNATSANESRKACSGSSRACTTCVRVLLVGWSSRHAAAVAQYHQQGYDDLGHGAVAEASIRSRPEQRNGHAPISSTVT